MGLDKSTRLGRKIIHGFRRRNTKRAREYNSWCHMRSRCHNPHHVKYQWYGARGISVCERWRRSFVNFYNDMGQGAMFNGALNEGSADVWGMSITHNPVLGQGAHGTSGSSIRVYNAAPKVYPQDIEGEVHADGEIIAGAWWDVATNINSVDTMTQIFTKTYYDTPDGPNGTEGEVYHDVLISALLNDDNDNNLNNGTPQTLK